MSLFASHFSRIVQHLTPAQYTAFLRRLSQGPFLSVTCYPPSLQAHLRHWQAWWGPPLALGEPRGTRCSQWASLSTRKAHGQHPAAKKVGGRG